jgi:transposase-like protein
MTMKTKYQSGFKEQALRKVFARASDRTVESIAIDLNMNIGTLRGWMKNASRDQKNPPPKPAHTSEWTAAQRLLALHESHDLKDEVLNAWCRERGIFAHDLTKWRSGFCAPVPVRSREESQELRQLRQANQQLQRDLNRKDKALAEAAALLVLQKKYQALWAAEEV